jgi:hypothetical protein
VCCALVLGRTKMASGEGVTASDRSLKERGMAGPFIDATAEAGIAAA